MSRRHRRLLSVTALSENSSPFPRFTHLDEISFEKRYARRAAGAPSGISVHHLRGAYFLDGMTV